LLINVLELQRPFHREHLHIEFPEDIDHISIDPQLLSGLQCYATRMSGALCCRMLFCLLQADTQVLG
jgi:hypothetical protein